MGKYFLCGSFLKWETKQEMAPDGDGGYTGTFKIRWSNKEDFYIIRDGDEKQAIYPAIGGVGKACIPCCGPDNKGGKGSDKYFSVRGPQHALVTVNVKCVDGKVTVTTKGPTEKTWNGWEIWCRDPAQAFYCTGSFNKGRFTPMIPDEDTPGVHTYRMQLGPEGVESFQIAVNEDTKLLMYPNDEGELRG